MDIVKSKKGFYIGDCNNPLDSDAYDCWLDQNDKNGKVYVDKKKYFLAYSVNSHANKDFKDQDDCYYTVYFQNIAIIPLEILQEQNAWKKGCKIYKDNLVKVGDYYCGRFVEGQTAKVSIENGILTNEYIFASKDDYDVFTQYKSQSDKFQENDDEENLTIYYQSPMIITNEEFQSTKYSSAYLQQLESLGYICVVDEDGTNVTFQSRILDDICIRKLYDKIILEC